MEILIYIGKVSLYWTLFYICYLLFLRQQTFFVWNRIYLIGSLFVSFALPFIIYPESAPAIPTIYAVSAPTITISTQHEASEIFTLTHLLWSVYILGALFMAYQFFTHARQLRGFLKQGELIELEDCTIILINSNNVGSFSFLKWIVVNHNDYENHFDAILRHEMVHMQQKHTIDVLLVEFLKIVFWFNPILIFYKKSLQEVHEFLADSEAPNREHYATFLVSYALNAPIASLTNHFFKPSQIKTRIQMIYKNRTSKWLLSSYAIVFATIGIVALIVAGCERKESDEFSDINKTFKAKDANGANFDADKIFSVVEEQPEFPGGTSEMFKFLGKNIRYPAAASRANVSGRVFLSFVVHSSGEIGDVVVLKGIGFGCDAEAVRVLKSFPKWTPGKQDGVPVNVRYNLPINFQLEDDEEKPASSTETSGAVVQGYKLGAVNKDRNMLLIIDNKIEKDKAALARISPDHIASMKVLTDNDATDAYGQKGENGVFEITTK